MLAVLESIELRCNSASPVRPFMPREWRPVCPYGASDEKGCVKGNDYSSRQIYLAKAHSPLTHRLAATVDSALVQEVSGVLQEIGKLTYGITGRRIASGDVMKYQSGER